MWAGAGVLVNELASPVLVLGLEAGADTGAGRLAGIAREAGEPLHLSLRALLGAPLRWAMSGRAVHVCENPAVVAIAADRLGGRSAPLVCTDGMPGAAQRTLLEQLVGTGARLRCHADFDWAGVRIANLLVRRLNAAPWRLSAADYELVSGRALAGPPVPAAWDPGLAPKMQARGYALDEEAVVEVLLADLAG